jgi:hypothetical protein
MKRAELQPSRPHPRVKGPPIEGDWRRLEALLADGVEPSEAAHSFGRTLSDFRRQDYYRQQRLLALSREARADGADRDLAAWAHAPDASDTIRVYWHRYTANAAGRGIERQQVELSVANHGEDRSASLADVAHVLREVGALERGNAAELEVADAGAVLAAPADGEREAGGVP